MIDANATRLQQLLQAIHDPQMPLCLRSEAYAEARPLIDAVAQRVARCAMGEEQTTQMELEVVDMLLSKFPDFTAASLGEHEDPEIRRYMLQDVAPYCRELIKGVERRLKAVH